MNENKEIKNQRNEVMEDGMQLERIISYIEEQQRMWSRRGLSEEREKENKQFCKQWEEKIWKGYTELSDAGFAEGMELFLVAIYFAGKPDETVMPLLRRLQMVMKNRNDIISGGMLAASYYGEEELSMRIPTLEDGIRNLYIDKKCIEALTGSIMIADGSPAEVAKAIQWYMFLKRNGFDVNTCRMARLIGLLAVISSSPNILGQKLLTGINTNVKSDKKDEKNIQDIFCEEACTYIQGLCQKEQERIRKLDRTSYKILTGEKNVTSADYPDSEVEEDISLNGSNLLTGMHQEVALILWAIHFGI